MDVNNNGQFFLCGLQECSSRKIHLHLTNLHEMESYSLKEYTYTNFKKSHLFLLLLPCGYVSFLLFERAGDFTLVKCGKTKQKNKVQRNTFALPLAFPVWHTGCQSSIGVYKKNILLTIPKKITSVSCSVTIDGSKSMTGFMEKQLP